MHTCIHTYIQVLIYMLAYLACLVICMMVFSLVLRRHKAHHARNGLSDRRLEWFNVLFWYQIFDK